MVTRAGAGADCAIVLQDLIRYRDMAIRSDPSTMRGRPSLPEDHPSNPHDAGAADFSHFGFRWVMSARVSVGFIHS